MRAVPRRTVAAGLAALAVPLVLAALAWACSPQAYIELSQAAGAPGGEVQVTGRLFQEGNPPVGKDVEIRWNDAAGPLLANAKGPNFTVTVTIPQGAPADTHTIVAKACCDQNNRPFTPSAAFTIQGSAPANVSGGETGGQGPATIPGSTTGTTGGGRTPGAGRNSATAVGPAGATAPGSAPAGAPAGAVGAPGSGGVASLPSQGQVFADSTSRAAGADGAADDAGALPRGSQAVPSAGSASGDLWSGYGSTATRGVLGGPAVPAEAPGSLPALSMALLGLGLVAIFSGAAVVALRRRRAPSHSVGPQSSD